MSKCVLCENTADHIYANIGPDLSCALSKLERIEAECASQSWDSYGADPVTAAALGAARTLARRLAALGMASSCIVPTNQGGISFTWQLGHDSEGIHLDISESGMDDPIGLWSPDGEALLAMLVEGLRQYTQNRAEAKS